MQKTTVKNILKAQPDLLMTFVNTNTSVNSAAAQNIIMKTIRAISNNPPG